MQTENVDKDFINILSAKSGMDSTRLSQLFTTYKEIRVLPYMSNDAFLRYNSLLEEFYRTANINKKTVNE